MSAEDEKENLTPGDAPAEPAAEAAKKPSRARKASAKAEAADEGETEEPVAKRPAAKKPAAKKSGADEPAANAEELAAKKPGKARKAAEEDAPAPEQSSAKKADVAEDVPPAPTRRKPAERRQVVRARARYVRTSARKARMVCGHIRGKSVQEARAILAFTPRDAARDWSKLLESAVANAENNHELLEDDLIVREAYADEGPTIKRFRPRAMGRATPIRKRTSHLTITLTPRS
jgi:ribosomal protein L22